MTFRTVARCDGCGSIKDIGGVGGGVKLPDSWRRVRVYGVTHFACPACIADPRRATDLVRFALEGDDPTSTPTGGQG